MEPELTPEQIESAEATMRAEVQKEIWGVDDASTEIKLDPEVEVKPEAKAEVEPEVKAEESDDARRLREAAEAAEARANELEHRLRSQEGRQAALMREIEALKKPKEEPEDMAAWNELEEKYGPVALAVKQYIGNALKGVTKGDPAPLAEKLREMEERGQVSEKQFNEAMLQLSHRGWKQTINTPEFKEWFETQPAKIKTLAKSAKWEDGDEVLSTYEKDTKAARDAAEEANRVQEERAGKLRASVTPIGKGGAPTGGSGGQTEEQIRAQVRKQVWGNKSR